MRALGQERREEERRIDGDELRGVVRDGADKRRGTRGLPCCAGGVSGSRPGRVSRGRRCLPMMLQVRRGYVSPAGLLAGASTRPRDSRPQPPGRAAGGCRWSRDRAEPWCAVQYGRSGLPRPASPGIARLGVIWSLATTRSAGCSRQNETELAQRQQAWKRSRSSHRGSCAWEGMGDPRPREQFAPSFLLGRMHACNACWQWHLTTAVLARTRPSV